MPIKYYIMSAIVIAVCFVQAPLLVHAASTDKEATRAKVEPGLHMIRINRPTYLPSSMVLMETARLHRPYKHAKCGGWIYESDELTDKGIIELRCEECGKKWNKKVATPR